MILSNIRENVEAYLQGNPQADIVQIRAHFGTPQELAASYVADLDMANLLKELRVGRRVMTAVTAGLLAILLLWGCGIAAVVAEHHAVISGYYESIVP